jgi:hypothetical protein
MRRIATLIFVFCLFHASAFAWCRVLPRLICAEYSQSKLVVIAKLTRKQHFESQGKQDYYVYSLEASNILRGEVSTQFRVWEENSSGRASFSWSVGKSYLLFLNPTDDGMWWLYGCGNSAPVAEAESTLKVIESLPDRQGGIIQGLVTDGEAFPPRSDLSAITIQIRGDNQDYQAVTNRKGEFKVHVPAGHYVVVPSQLGRKFEKSFESFENPDDVVITNGGGAQVQFERK